MARSRVGESGFEVVLAILRRRKWAGLIAFAVMFSLAAPFSIFLPDIYRGSATVIIESQEAPSAFVKPSVTELETRLVTLQQELLSRRRLADLIVRLNLYPQWREHASLESLAERMRQDIQVEPSGTDLSRGIATTIGIRISYIGLDPESAAKVPNALASLYVEENTKMRERQTGQLAQFLKSQVARAAEELERHENRLNVFKDQRAGELPEQITVNLVTLERLNTQLRLNTDEQLRVRERQEGFVGQSPNELSTLTRRLRELQTKFTDQHPEVIQLKAQIREAERNRAEEGSVEAPLVEKASSSGTNAELGMLKKEERTLRSEIAAYNQRIQYAPKIEQELEALDREYATAKTTYDSLVARYEEAQLAESLEQTKKGESFRILDPAVVPTVPAAPNRDRLLLMAFMIALASGIGVMLLTEHLDTSFHTLGELRQFTSVPVLASIPYLTVRTNFASQAVRIVLFAGAVMTVCALMAGFAYHTARENTQLVWMLAGSQL